MSLAIAAAHVPDVDGWFTPANNARGVFDPTAHPAIRARNDSTTQGDTVNLFIDGLYDDMEYEASIISACTDKTLLALRCTSVPFSRYVDSRACGPSASVFSVTVGPSTYEVSTAISTSSLGINLVGSAHERCVLASPTATCTATISASAQGQSTALTTAITLRGADYHTYDVRITGGAEKTASPAATCGFGTSAASNVNPKALTMWALAGFAGVIGVLAM